MRKDTQQQTYSHRNSPVFPFNDQRCSNNFVVAARLFFNILLNGSSRPHYDVMSAQFEVISTVIRLFFFFFVSLSAQHHIVNYSVSSINSIRSFVFSYFYYSSAQFKCYNNSMNFSQVWSNQEKLIRLLWIWLALNKVPNFKVPVSHTPTLRRGTSELWITDNLWNAHLFIPIWLLYFAYVTV